MSQAHPVCLSAPRPWPKAEFPSRPREPQRNVVLLQILVRARGVRTKPPFPVRARAGADRQTDVSPRGWRTGRSQGVAAGVLVWGQARREPATVGVCFAPFGSLPRPAPPAGAAAGLPGVSEGRASAGLTAWSVLSPERGAKPVTSFVKNLSALSDWYSVYTSAIAFTVSAPRGWVVGCAPSLRFPEGPTHPCRVGQLPASVFPSVKWAAGQL